MINDIAPDDDRDLSYNPSFNTPVSPNGTRKDKFYDERFDVVLVIALMLNLHQETGLKMLCKSTIVCLQRHAGLQVDIVELEAAEQYSLKLLQQHYKF